MVCVNMLVVQLHLPERACRCVLRGAPMLYGREVATLMLPAGWDEYMDDEYVDGDATGSDTDSYMRAPSSAAPARQPSPPAPADSVRRWRQHLPPGPRTRPQQGATSKL